MDLICYHNFQLLACTVFISSLFVTDGASPNRRPAAVDHCLPNPCQNGAICRTLGDRYSCYCVPGFQGAHCQIDVNECISEPCRNGATCVDRVGRFSCLCSPEFTGATCEVEIDECQSKPCLNGGSCYDYTGGFTCTCPPGFQGHQCEDDIDECQHQPCQNGAPCVDGVNEYSCDCSHTAFNGRHCETPIPSCHSEPCFNSAPCRDNQRNYTCECWPGFEGRQCEIDINECGSSPCVHGGRCIERSWQVLYGTEPLLPAHYDQQHAAGYVCSCPPGTAGSLCQEVINPCDPSPCQNGGVCEAHVGGYMCYCLRPSPDVVLYGGVHCDVRLQGCDAHDCQNEASCSPFLLDETHGYNCLCTPGYTGPHCTTSTTFSFERSGFLLLQSPLVDSEFFCNITLSFRTVLPRAVLFQRSIEGMHLSLELDEGRLHLTLSEKWDSESLVHALELPRNVTDGEWHSVEALLGNWALSLKLLDDGQTCESHECHRVASFQSTLAGHVLRPQSTLILGALEETNGRSEGSQLPAFIGCMRDVFVDWQLVLPEEWLSDSVVNVTPGCSHRDRCLDVPCQNRGQCVNLWYSYRCICPRPYKGHNCKEEHATARFGNEDSHSYAVFSVIDDVGHNLNISLFLRTRKSAGLLLVLANSSSQHLRVWLEVGKAAVQLNNGEILKGESAIDDGEIHFVSVEVSQEHMALQVDSQKQVEVRTVSVQAGDVVYVGGMTDTWTTAEFGGYFKGCIQDLRINERMLQFFGLDASVRSFPLVAMANVTSGCSGDNACSRNPCRNGGMCFSMWDDFTCICPPSTVGRRCEEVRWCELSPCPSDAECRMLNQGYECYFNVTFLNDSTVLSYRGNGDIIRNLTDVSLNLRTLQRHAVILHAQKDSAFFTLAVQHGFLFMELQSTTGHKEKEEEEEGTRLVILSSQRSVSDGEWHSVRLFMEAPWAQTSHWTLVLDDDIEEAIISESIGGNLDFLREGVDIYLGGLGPGTGGILAGCLDTVEVGGIALPYFSSFEVNLPRLQEEQFIRTSAQSVLPGCSRASVCHPNPCLNGGECQDLFNMYNCSCAEGWAGRHCDVLKDACASHPCVHGNCSTNGLTYKCACEFGYRGVDCEEEVDVCENHLCAHGGTCLHGPNRYACLCAENYTGPYCNESVEEIPWYIVVRKVKQPRLPVSVCGDDTRNYTCFNGGNCTERDLSCVCPPGFAGHRCEQEVDECKSNPCLNGGYCRNLIDRFICVCDMSYAGDVCQTDVSDIYFYVAVLLWQNLFQLLSYLILRLDDEPEVDWGGND